MRFGSRQILFCEHKKTTALGGLFLVLAYWNDYRHANWQQASLYSEQVDELNAIYAN